MAEFDPDDDDDDDEIVRRMGSMSVHNQSGYNSSNQCQTSPPSFLDHSHTSSLIDEDSWVESFSTASYDAVSSASIASSSNPFMDFNQQQQYSGSTTPARVDLFPNDDGSSASDNSLPEFKGSGGGQGIFKLPLRAPVHPGRPPSFELRPHPIRETQAGSFFRTIVCTPTQLWAGLESGVRAWSLSEVFAPREERGIGMDPLHEKNTAPFKESIGTSPTLCFAVDTANQRVWSGHKDGGIRFWNVDHSASSVSSFSDDDYNATSPSSFKESLCWTAHRAHPVLSMTFTSYGKSAC